MNKDCKLLLNRMKSNIKNKKFVLYFIACLTLIFLVSCSNPNSSTEAKNDAIVMDETYYYDFGKKCLNEGRIKDAVESFNKAIEPNPNIAELYTRRGIAKSGLKEYESAIKDLEIASQLSPEDLSIINTKGDVEFNGELYDKALKDYNFVIEKDSTSIGIYLKRGLVKIKMGLKNEGCDDLYKAQIKGDPDASIVISKNCK